MILPLSAEIRQQLLRELFQVPQALKELTAFYGSTAGQTLMEHLPEPRRILFIGSDSEMIVARLAARQCRQAGLSAQAVEAAELIKWPKALFADFSVGYCLSMSGSSAEMNVLVERDLPLSFIALTAASGSSLAHRAQLVLPLYGAKEDGSAISSLPDLHVLAWLIVHRLVGQSSPADFEQLKRLRQYIQLLIEGREALIEQWQACLAGSRSYIFCGQGDQALVAALAAQKFAAWADLQTVFFSESELAGNDFLLSSGWSVISLREKEFLTESEENFWQTLAEEGTPITFLRNGFPQQMHGVDRPALNLDAGISLLLNLMACQILALGEHSA